MHNNEKWPNIHAFFISKQAEAGEKLGKSEATPWGWTFTYWKVFAFFSPRCHMKSNGKDSKKCTKNKCVCFNYVI